MITTAGKRIKLSSDGCSSIEKAKIESPITDSTDQGLESDFSSQLDVDNSCADFSLPPVKRKTQASRHVSFSLSKCSSGIGDSQQSSLGYSSMLSSSSTAASPCKSKGRSPRKRKLEESDENAYHFASPPKLHRNDLGNRAKLILKEKCSSENVILSSTPINSSQRTKWGKFRSLHPERFEIRKIIDDAEVIEKCAAVLPKSTEVSFNCSSFDLTNSFEITNIIENQDKSNIPNSFQQLYTGPINVASLAKPQAKQTAETITKPQGVHKASNASSTERRFCYAGRLKFDILKKLDESNNLALDMILSYLNAPELLSVSHVSKAYCTMIESRKNLEAKRQNYLAQQRQNRENKLPGSYAPSSPKSNALKTHKRAFGELNANHSMQLRPKPVSPPVSPSRRKFHENQKVALTHTGTIKKCPRCSKPAKIHCVKIRSSPRKKKKVSTIFSISSRSPGRVQKRNKSFLSTSSIASYSCDDSLFVTLPMLQEHSDNSSGSSSGESPTAHSSDESAGSGNEAESYEYGVCSGIACNFKFCVKCNCKYHPRQICKDFSPSSPSRLQFNKSSGACSTSSYKSLKRLVY